MRIRRFIQWVQSPHRTLLVGTLFVMAFAGLVQAQEQQALTAVKLAPVSPTPSTALARVPQLTAAQREELQEKHEAILEAEAAEANSLAISGGATLDDVPETQLAPAIQFPGNPADFVIGRISSPPDASDPSSGISLAEPAGANVGAQIYMAGNLAWAMFSDDGGATWTDDTPGPGPADAPFPFGDQDVIVDPASRVFFRSTIYVNGSLTQSYVGVAVLRNPDAGPSCTYFFHSTASGNVLSDYPKMGLTKRFFYYTANEIGSSISGGQQAAIYRWGLDQMENCVGTPGSVFVWNRSIDGQRVWVPAGGTANGETMYWAHIAVDGTTLRLFRWNEDTGLFLVNNAVAGSNFGAADCRGGANNTNWIDSLQTSIIGFSTRSTVTAIRNNNNEYERGILVYWQSADIGAGRPQAFVRGALFRDGGGGFSLFSQPDIFNGSFCFGYQVATANKRGDVGVAIGIGGAKGGGGFAEQATVGIADEFSGGNGFLANVFTVASGTHNPADGRFGDYFTVHANEPCENWFGATGYALSGGTDTTSVNEVYAEFGRNQSVQCWNGWFNADANPGQP